MPVPVPIAIVDSLLGPAGRSDGVVVYPHIGADGDALGASFGLSAALQRIGIRSLVVLEEPPTAPFGFLPGADRALVRPDPADPIFTGFQTLAIALDCEGPQRLGARAPMFQSAPVRIVIDHHPSAFGTGIPDDGVLRFIDPTASSCGELVHRVLQAIASKTGSDPMDTESAQCLLAALLADTGGFRFANANAESFLAAAAYLAHGADVRSLTQRIFDATTPGRLRITGRAFTDARFDCGGRIASFAVPASLIEECGAMESDLDGIAGRLRDVDGVEVAFVLRERGEQEGIRVNARSGDGFDSCAFARGFGGGGHARASGFTVEASLEDARERVLSQARKVLGCSETD
jgi:phosphoesterase RecJ-like protein